MNLYEYIDAHPVYTFFLGFYLLVIVSLVGQYVISVPMRHASIRKHGWPPAHIDADGDRKDQEAAKR